MMMSGRTLFNASSASSPLVADSTAKPRSSRKRHTVCRMSMESSTTKATTDMTSPRAIVPRLTLTNGKSPKQGKGPREGYLRHARGSSSGFFLQPAVLDHHVLKLTRFENVAALQALD